MPGTSDGDPAELLSVDYQDSLSLMFINRSVACADLASIWAKKRSCEPPVTQLLQLYWVFGLGTQLGLHRSNEVDAGHWLCSSTSTNTALRRFQEQFAVSSKRNPLRYAFPCAVLYSKRFPEYRGRHDESQRQQH